MPMANYFVDTPEIGKSFLLPMQSIEFAEKWVLPYYEVVLYLYSHYVSSNRFGLLKLRPSTKLGHVVRTLKVSLVIVSDTSGPRTVLYIL